MSRFCGTSACATKFKKVSHVIFDMDGVLLDTEKLYTVATQNIVARYGKTFDWSMKAQVMALPGKQSAIKIVELLDLPITADEYYELAQEEYAKVMPDAELMPGAEKLVRHLHLHNVPIAVATSSGQDSFALKSKNHKELFSLFHHIVCGGTDSEVKRGKPHPDIFLVCASRFPDKPKSENCLVFEDAPNGVQAAVAAGMQVIMMPDENVPEHMQKDAHHRISSFDDFDLAQFGLPPFKCNNM